MFEPRGTIIPNPTDECHDNWIVAQCVTVSKKNLQMQSDVWLKRSPLLLSKGEDSPNCAVKAVVFRSDPQGGVITLKAGEKDRERRRPVWLMFPRTMQHHRKHHSVRCRAAPSAVKSLWIIQCLCYVRQSAPATQHTHTHCTTLIWTQHVGKSHVFTPALHPEPLGLCPALRIKRVSRINC